MKTGTSYPPTWNRVMIDRAKKLEQLNNRGINPYLLTKFSRTHSNRSILANSAIIPEGESLPEGVKLAGRLVSVRRMGKVIFAHIEDESARAQVFIAKNDIGEEAFSIFKELLEVGDYVGLQGDMFRTKTGEITLKVKQYDILSKALRPLPDKWHGLKDEEIRQRQRYLDLASSAEVRERFRQRSQVVWLMRQFLHHEGFMEVETPILQEIHGGAAARPFATHHNTLNMELYLRIATELHLKRLIAGGYERVFEIGRIFRNEGIDRSHNPEFTSMEVYWAYADYHDMMNLTEQCVSYIVEGIFKKHQVNYQDTTIDFSPPWKRMTMEESLGKIANIDVNGMSLEKLRSTAVQRGVSLEDDMGRGWIITTLFEELVEKELVQPTFIYRYPVETTPLAKRCPDNPDFVERFEGYIARMELANAFSELNDPIDQRARFEEQARALVSGNEEAHPFDEDFVQAIEIGMPPTGGLGIGIDRLAMVLTNSPSIRDVILFPTMKRKG